MQDVMIAYIILMYLLSLVLAYELSFVQATLQLGRAISSGQTRTGYQDAITPPWSSTLGLIIYGACAVGVIVGLVVFGWVTGIVAAIGLYVATLLNKVFLMPKPQSEHFLRLIVASLSARFANYTRDGDHLRAGAAADMLEKIRTYIQNVPSV